VNCYNLQQSLILYFRVNFDIPYWSEDELMDLSFLLLAVSWIVAKAMRVNRAS